MHRYPELYPAEYNKPELILQNLEKICEWVFTNNFQIPRLDLFSGDIWDTPFGWQVLQTIYNYVTKGMRIGYILIASNCSFVANDKALQTIQQYIDKFAAIDCPIIFSISVDGKIIDNEGRPDNKVANKYTDEYYNAIGSFARANGYRFHPMISSSNVKYWKENYEWWKQFLDYFEFNKKDIMTLEVRNGDWTDESIQAYGEFLEYLMDEYLHEDFHNDTTAFASAIVASGEVYPESHLSGYVPWVINVVDTFHGCTVSNHLTIRVGDLAICPCHRTAYQEYLYGYLETENGRITSKVHAINPTMAINILMSNMIYSTPICNNCIYNNCCLNGCLGSQLESERDPFFPKENVCKFFHHKYDTILKWYEEHGVIDILKTRAADDTRNIQIANILQIYSKYKEEKENGLGKTNFTISK